MATTSRVRATPATASGRRRVPRESTTLRLMRRLRSTGRDVASMFDGVLGPSRLRREMLGAGLVLLAILSAWALGRGGQDGRLVAWWGRLLEAVCGRGALLVPFLIGLIAIRAFRDTAGPMLHPRHYLGGFAFGVAVFGLLQLAGEPLDPRDGGGYLGAGVARVLREPLGELGSGLLLYAAGTISVFLLAGTDVRTFWRDLRALWPRRPPVLAEEELEPLQGKAVTPETAPPPRATAPLPRVINVPKREQQPAKSVAAPTLAPTPPGKPLPLPDISQLAYYDGVALDTADLDLKARLIEETLASFKVDTYVREINPGPAVTQFALEPGVGVKVRRITELQNDLALALAAPSIRLEAPVPGMARVGLEIPNAEIAKVGLRETLESASFGRNKAKLPIPLGRDVNGRYAVHDLTKMPHLLIAGATGSGKSVCLNAIIATFLLTRTPDDLKLLMIDPKQVELTGYNGVPHLQCPVVTEMDKVVGLLRLVLQEMERRYTIFSKLGVRNLDGYRMKMADEPEAENLAYLVVIIDELADLMMTAPEEVETLLVRLAQKARATGIHLIIATQRPSVDVLTGLIKANVPARVAFAVTSGVDSRVILDMPGAERLLGQGDMLFLPPDAAKPQRIQGSYIEDKDLQYVVSHWHAVAPVPRFAEEWLNVPSSNADDIDGEDDPLMEQALEIVRQQGTASASMLQRRLRIGYNRAARLIEQMEDEGIIGPADGLRGRLVLIGEE
jgi:S-DNA-T family DNA segregation ATPase FtsK/SpoIIIE